VVHDLVELRGKPGIDRLDCLVDRARQVAVEGDRADQGLLDQRLDEFLGAVRLGLFGCGDDLYQEAAGQRRFRDSRGGIGRKLEIGNGSALLFVEAKLARQGLELAFVLQNLLE
jgi:hypothetical protein